MLESKFLEVMKLCKRCVRKGPINFVRNALTSVKNNFIKLIQRLKLNCQYIQHIPYVF